MKRLTKQQKEEIINKVQEGIPISDEYRFLVPFETEREYELTYTGKERKEDILADTLSVPFQPIKKFGEVRENECYNMLIFGDNLQALKHLLKLKEQGKIRNPDGRNGVKLVYIDPPFATEQEFRGSKDQKAYQDKIAGAEFLEFLRKRLFFLKELLTDDGSLYVHLDWRKVHYIKLVLDEIFGEQNLRREIIWTLKGAAGYKSLVNSFVRGHDTILYYSKSENVIFNKVYLPYSEEQLGRFTKADKYGRKFKPITKTKRIYLDEAKGVPITDVWTDIASFQTVV